MILCQVSTHGENVLHEYIKSDILSNNYIIRRGYLSHDESEISESS